MKEKIVGIGIAGIVSAILGWILNYLMMPAWNIHSVGMWFFIAIIVAVFTVTLAITEYDGNKKEKEKKEFYLSTVFGIVFLLVLLVLIIGGISSSHMFNAKKYHSMIMIEEGNFEQDIPKFTDETQIPIVDVGTAQKVGDRTVGSIKNAAWYEVDDEYNLIKYQGKYYRISELNYGGFFKYTKAKKEGIPGYVLVDCSNQEAKYVELREPIKYSPSGHFSSLLKRHLRGQYPSYMFGKSFFEIDEQGNPYYITSVQTATIGLFGGKKEESFIITNASTGESKEYKVEELPEWVDHAYDLSYLMEVIDNNQKYVNGYWNSVFAKTGVNATAYQYRDNDTGYVGYNTTITSNGDIEFYTGVTPVSDAQSNVGFILANPRNGKVKYYTCAGAEESSAQEAAESLVQNFGYIAAFPTMLNIDGTESYMMLLKDKAGLVQRYALCDVKDHTKVVQAEKFEDAVSLYKEKIGSQVSTEEAFRKEGEITSLYQAQVDGCTYYYFMINEEKNLYMSSIKNSNRQVMLAVGTKVSVEYVPSSEEGVFIVKSIEF